MCKNGLILGINCSIFVCMKKTTIVVILLLMSGVSLANNIMLEINTIESQWARIYYDQNTRQKKVGYPVLLKKIQSLSDEYPEAIEPKIWEALVIATNAEFESPFSALDSINVAKKILEETIQKNPVALDGAAFVILGTLYYMTPGWPISFGDEGRAEQLLKRGLEINPASIDSNYFYADYLLSQNKITEAQRYFKLAINSPSRPEQQYADEQLKREAIIALKNTEERKLVHGRNNFLSLFSSAKSN